MDDFVHIASSSELASLQRLEKYLLHHGITCRLLQDEAFSGRHHLEVSPLEAAKAEKVLEEIAYTSSDPENAEELVEIRFDGNERTEVSTWLQILLDEEDREGSPIFYFRPGYEVVLDELHASGHVEIPVYLLKGLRSYLPEDQKRLLMGRGLQEFFNLIEAVSASGEE